MQRAFDIVLSSVIALPLLPILLVLAIVLRLTGEGEIFFLQNRVGLGGKHFKIFKFATMLKESPNIGSGTVTVKDDPRILPIGSLLRKTKVNELPQLINIFNGTMSFIGPRPQTQRCFEAFPATSQKEIIKVLPGLSGIGSIIFRDEEEMMHGHTDSEKFYDEIVMPYKGALEEWYVSRQSFFTYVNLIALTVWVVARPRTDLAWKVFQDLPVPPDNLKRYMGYPRKY